MGAIKHIQSMAEHDALLEEKKESLVVIDFHADWCGEQHAPQRVLIAQIS
jgi:thiol:disulfide interchange protein